MRDMCIIKVSLGNTRIDTTPANVGNSYKTTSNETESPDECHQSCLPGFETVSDEVAAEFFHLTVPELYRRHLVGRFPDPAWCQDDSPRWLFWELLLWGLSDCPPMAEWDMEEALEEHRDSFRRAVRMHLERLVSGASEDKDRCE